MNVVDKIQKTIHAHDLFKPGDRIIVAVSGGPDSVFLLHALISLRHDLGIKITVAHLNHLLRRNAARDQRFVRQLAEKWQVPFVTASIDVRNEKRGDSPEEKAREARLRFLIRTARKYHAHAIALGHTRDDLAETILMRLLRGTGLAGMRAIRPKRQLNGATFVRPLLDVSKKEAEEYLKKKHLKFRIDATNRQLRFSRNKIRLHLLPLLEKGYNKNIKTLLANLSDMVATDYDYMEGLARRTFEKSIAGPKRRAREVRFSLSGFRRHHPSLQRMLIRLAIKELKGNTNRLTFSHIAQIERMLSSRGHNGSVHLPGEILALKDKTSLCLKRRNP